MTLVLLIGLVMGFVLFARFLKIFDKAVEWLYLWLDFRTGSGEGDADDKVLSPEAERKDK